MTNFLRRTLFVIFAFVLFFQANAQNNFWRATTENQFLRKESQKRLITPVAFNSYKLDTSALLSVLQSSPIEFTEAAKNNPLIISLPLPDGSINRFSVVYSPIMAPELQSQFPNIRTFSGQGIDDPTAKLRFDWTEFGFHAQVISATNDHSFYIDPYAQGEKTQYISYYKKDLPAGNKQFIEHGVIEEQLNNLGGLAQRTTAGICLGSTLRTYRLAVACTGEYAVAVGATTVAQALSAITTTVNRVDGIYESELSIRLTLIGNETSIIYTDATTDPFTGNNSASTLINESQTVIDANIGSANYDIGHTFSTGAGGLAGRGVVCNSSQKARGVTGSTLPVGDAYDVDFVAHEMGHQFGANHTFNATTSNCGGGNRNASTAVEPGSGITIMAYAGICSATNDLAAHSIPYFHAISENEIATYVTVSTGSICGTTSPTGNSIPVVNVGNNYTIPASTPFMLSGSATDANNSEVLTYSWEEIDNGISGNWNSGNAPYFRSFSPSLSRTRYFPQLSDVLSATTTIGEILPTTSQTLNFRLTVRDNRPNGGGVCSADMSVNVDATGGPFTVTSQNTATTWTANGTNTATITWNVANTNAAPFSVSNVSILFSADGGYTYPYTLVASTPNNGTATITIPSVVTSQGRVMVKASGNIFFNVNAANITINTSCAAEGAIISPSSSVTALRGNAALNLSLSPQYSTTFAPSGQIVSGDPTTNLSIYDNGTGTCGGPYCNLYKYKTMQFVVTQTGSYTFNRTGAGSIFGIYAPTFDPNAMCNNLVKNNYSGGTAASLTANLVAGTTYTLVIGVTTASASGTGGCTDQAFNTSASNTLPFSYSISITPPTGGTAYGGSSVYINPGAGFTYTYVMVNNSTNNIVAIGSPNLTNSSTYPPGQYTVYGLSYSNTIANLNSYIGGSLNALLSQITNNPSSFCANLSKNAVTVNVTGVLPVQLTALKARKQGEKVILDWGTVTEQNSSHFMVQRSANGIEFGTEIGKVAAAGNSNTPLSYTFVDASAMKGWNYYRIKEVDLDGRYTYTNVAAVNFDKGGSMVIYPNPAKDVLNIDYTSEKTGKLEIQVVDSKGSVLMKKSMNISVGRTSTTMNIATLSKGMYMLKYIDADGSISFTKFLKQ